MEEWRIAGLAQPTGFEPLGARAEGVDLLGQISFHVHDTFSFVR